MGIKQLKSFLKGECAPCTHVTTLAVAANKTIVVDTSIYMYEFCRNGGFIEGFQSLMELYHEYEITPIFIFDGKMPPTKKRVVQERAEVRHRAIQDLEVVNTQLQECHEMPDSDPHKSVILAKRTDLLAQTVRITSDQPKQLRDWMKARQISFLVADGEADVLCAQMVLAQKAWGCMSNDTDMFMYNCPHVLSNVSITGENRGECMYYCLDEILDHLNMDKHSFMQMLVLAGSEYTPHLNHTNIYKIYRKWSMYMSYRQQFYSKWLGPVIPLYVWYQRYLKLTDEKDIESYEEHIKTYHKIVSIVSDPDRLPYACQ